MLTDSRALLSRAKVHYAELVSLWNRERADPLWSIAFDRVEGGQFRYQLKLNRPLLVQMRPVMADTANNIVAALDHVIAATARLGGHGREVRTYFPWLFEDEPFRRAIAQIAGWTGPAVAGAIEDIWFNDGFERPHLRGAKELSNSGKHWELLHSVSGAHCIQMAAPGDRRRFDVPEDAFEGTDAFEFLRVDRPLGDVPFYIVLSLAVRGLPEGIPSSPDSIFECSLRIAERIIDAVEARI